MTAAHLALARISVIKMSLALVCAFAADAEPAASELRLAFALAKDESMLRSELRITRLRKEDP